MVLNVKTITVAGVAIAGLVFLGGQAFAKNAGGTRPGWGYGDHNHVHTGPPGQSVRPDHDEDANEVNEDTHHHNKPEKPEKHTTSERSDD